MEKGHVRSHAMEVGRESFEGGVSLLAEAVEVVVAVPQWGLGGLALCLQTLLLLEAGPDFSRSSCLSVSVRPEVSLPVRGLLS